MIGFLFLAIFKLSAQGLDVTSCPTMVKRSNGNGQANAAPGDFRPQSTQNNPVAANVIGTSYQLVPFLPTTKTGDVHFKWTSNTPLASIPVITRVWLTAEGSNSAVLSNIKFGPPSAVVPSAPNYYIDYCFYNNNMPNQGRVTLEFSNPQTNTPAFTCSYELRANISTTTPVIDCAPTINTQPVNQVLCGSSSATFSVNASGATGYQWQVSTDGTSFANIANGGVYSGALTNTLSITTPNTNNGKFYRVVVSGAGCPSATSTAAKLVATPLPTAVFGGSSSYCGTGNRSLAIQFTGTAPFSVTYTVAGSPFTVNNIASSPYYISVAASVTSAIAITSVSDANCINATPTGNTAISIYELPVISTTGSSVCIGTGSFSLPYALTGSANQYSVTAGTRNMPGFSAVSNATLVSAPLSVSIPTSGVVAGTYDFTLVVSNTVTGCVSASVPFTVTVNALPVISASAGSNNVCAATAVVLTAAPANLTSYSWSASPLATISAIYNPTVNPTATTIYTVTGTNSNGCQSTGTVTVNVIAGPTISITPSAPVICSGNSSTLTASGGSTYSWSPSTGLNTTAGAMVIATPTTTTIYTVTSQNATGCASTGTVTVTVVSTPSIAITNSSPTLCSGSVSTLTATGGFTNYTWYPVTGLYTDAPGTVAYTGTSSVATVYAKPSATTMYTVVGTTSGGCITSSTSTVTLSAAPVNTTTSVGNYYTFCTSGTSTFSFAVNTTVAVTSLTWSYSTTQAGPYTSFTSAVSPTGATFTPSNTTSTANLTASNYANSNFAGPRFLRLVIIDASCTYNYDIQIFDTKGQGASVPLPVAAQSSICSGASTSLTIGALNSALTIQWQTSTDNVTFTNISGATTTNYTTPTLTATTYYKAIIGGQGSCSYTTGSVTITVGAPITTNTVTPATSCTDGSTFIALSGNAITGGIYQWQRSTTSSTTGFTDLTGATSQNYTLTRNLVPVTTWYRRLASTSTCNANTSAAVVVYAPLANNTVTTVSATMYCASAPAISIAGAAPVGGDGTTYTYQWQSSTDNSTYTNISGATAQNYTTPIASVTTYYRRQITGGGCTTSTSDPLLITVNPNPTVTVTPTSSTVCGGNTLTLTASGATSYLWSPATELSSSTGASVIATLTVTRTYTVTGTSANGCTSTATSTLTYTAPPANPVVSSFNVTICSTTPSYNLTALVTSGGTTEWFTAPVASATYLVSTPTAVTTARTYYVFSKSGSCYSASYASVTLTIASVVAPVVSSTAIALCSPATANLAALQPVAATGTILEWHTGSTSASAIVATPSAAGAGTYYLFAYSAAGNCYGPASSAVTVTVNALPVSTVSGTPATVCAPNTVNLDSYNTTGNATNTYQWYSVSSNPTPATLISIPAAVGSSGSYYLYATSSAGCKGSASSALNVTINATPTASITAPSTVCAASSLSIVTATNAASPTYVWQNSTDGGNTYSTVSNGGIYSGATTATLAISNATGLDGYVYKYIVTASSGCSAASTSVNVSVDATASISAQPTNYSATAGSSALFKITTTGSPTVNYQWAVSTDGGTNYTNIADGSVYQGTTTSDLVIIAATAGFSGYKYRCTISNNCTSAINSQPAILTVSSCVTASVGGTVSGGGSSCTGTNTNTLTLAGYTGTILRWESSMDNFATDPFVINTVTNTLTVNNLTATTNYRAVVQSGSCTTAYSSNATVVISSVTIGGSVTGAASVCTGTNSTTLTLSGHTGTVVKWQSSTNNFSTSTDIVNTTNTFTATNLGANTQYRAVVQSGACASTNSSIATITVYQNGQWIGGVNGDWNNAANWCGGVPTTPVNVNIPAGSTVTITNANAYANNVSIDAGGSLVMNGTGNLYISDGGVFTNNGSFDASASTTGKVSFSGTGLISGTVTFKNLETFGALNFGTASTISGEFTLQTGGSVTGNAPTYNCPGSTLIYRGGSIFRRGLEWTTATSGAGYPSNVYVQNSTTLNFPVAGPGWICNDLVVDNGSSLNQNYSGGSAQLTVARDVIVSGNLSLGDAPGGDISLGRNWTRNSGGVFTHNNRTVNFINSFNSTITAPMLTTARDANGAFGGETFYKMSMNKSSTANTVTLGSHISILKELNLQKGSFNLGNSDVTIVSKDEETGAIAAIPTSGGVINGVSVNYTGTGKFVIQRHLSIGTGSVSRRWRVLCAPLQTTAAPTVSEAWQMGVSNADRNNPVDPWPGFGTTITKSTSYDAADGYDQGSTNNPSMYGISNSGSLYIVLPSTKVPINTYEAYMLFARGNRGIVVSTPFINATTTILEPKGRIHTGNVQKSLVSGYQVYGNPYASSISFSNITLNNYTYNGTTFNNATPGSVAGIGLTYYLWDPKTSGTSNVGKWITLSSRGDGTYDVTANASGLRSNGEVQSSAAFAIYVDNAGGTLTFHETDKVATSSSVGVASRGQGISGSIASLNTNLYVANAQAPVLADGVINTYHVDYNNQVDGQDARKYASFNTGESMSIEREGKTLAIERRNAIAENDTVFLKMTGMNKTSYQLQFVANDLPTGTIALLEDAYTGVASPISLLDTTNLSFKINDDAASSAANRFRIVFKSSGVLPLSFTGLQATPQGANVMVQWQVQNEAGTTQYVIERSANGRDFNAVSKTPAKAISPAGNNYNWLDAATLNGDNFYRVGSISANGAVAYSNVVKVKFSDAAVSAQVYPNPVRNLIINLSIKNAERMDYNCQLTNTKGQVVYRTSLIHASGNNSYELKLANHLAPGSYYLSLHPAKGDTQMIKVVIE